MKRIDRMLFLCCMPTVLWAAAQVPLPDPDLSALEPTVAEQISEVREMALTVVHNQLASSADKVKVWAEMAQLFHAYQLFDAAEACYAQAEALDPENADWIYYRGHVALAVGDAERAAGHFARVLERRPEDLATLVHLSDLEVQRGNRERARELLERGAAVDPTPAVLWARLGELALAEGRNAEAIRLLEAVLEAVPAASRLHHALGLAYRGLGDLDKAREHLARRGEVGIAPVDPLLEELERVQVGERVHLLRGRKAFQAGRLAEAAEEFRLAVAAEPGSVRARINLSAALGGMNDAEGAMRELRQVVQLAPENPTARFNLASLLAAAGEHREAISHYAVATAFRPHDEEAWLGEARSWIALGDFSRATARLSVANSTAPESGRIAFGLARLLAASPDLSVRDGKRALALSSRVFEAQVTLEHALLVSLALRELGRCDDARAWLDDLIARGEAEGSTDEVTRLRARRAALAGADPCRP